jgi:hypothetical protein
VRNSTATYYDGQTTAMAEQNLLTYSQDFRNTADAGSTRPWLYSGITNTYGADIAPDGTTTANYLQETATTAIHILSSSAVNSVTLGSTAALTCSIYFKKGLGSTAPDWIQINTGGASNCYASFNLTTGLVGNYGGGSGILATNPINVGAGWYRCIITLATAGSGVHYFYPGFTNNTNPTSRYPSYLGAITSDVQAWGFQIEQRSSATAYTPTTTTAITNYIPVLMTAPAGVARFDCDPITGTSLGLLIEESRTNLLLYSATFSNAAWTLTNATLTAAATIAPDGTQTAFNLVSNTSTGLQAIAQTVTKAASALAYTSTIHFKANQYTYSWLQISDGAGNGAIVYFNLTTGAISTAVAGIGTAFTALSATTPTSIGNGWYRCNITGTSNTATSLVTQFGSSTNGTSNSVVGNGYSGVFIWGAQAE